MNTFERKFYWIVIAVMVVIIIFMKSCGHACPPAAVIKTTDTIWRESKSDTIKVDKPVPYAVYLQGKPIPVTVTDTMFLSEYVDTSAILMDYNKSRKYHDKLGTDTAYVILDEQVNQNKIFDRQIIFHIKYPEIHSTAIVPPKNKVFMGLDIGGSSEPWVNGGIGLALLTKTDNLYTIRAGITTQAKWYAGGTLYWKIHF